MKVYQLLAVWLIGRLTYLAVLIALIAGAIYAVMWALQANGVI